MELPIVEEGDILMVRDTGAYTMSMYSKYNSITPSSVYAFEHQEESAGPEFAFYCFKQKETSNETLAFWGNKNAKTACKVLPKH